MTNVTKQQSCVGALAACLAITLNLGYMYGMSRLLTVIIDTFQTTRARASVIQATSSSVFWCTSAISGMMVQRYGTKRIGIVGAMTAALAITLSYFANSVLFLALSHGVSSFGTSLVAMSIVANIGHTFDGKTVQLVISLVLSGCGVGGMAYSYLLDFLQYNYGLRGTLLIIGGILMNSIPLVLYLPSESSAAVVKKDELLQESDPETIKTQRTRDKTTTAEYSFKDTVKRLVRQKAFLVFVLGGAITTASQMTFLIFLTDLLKDRRFNPSSISLGLLLYSLATIFGRLLPGTLKQIKNCSSLSIPLMSTAFGVAASILIALVDDRVTSFVACCASGLSFGLIGVCMPNVSVTLVGKQYLAPSFGFALSMCGVVTLLSGPINGYIRDSTESYVPVFLLITATTALGGVFFVATWWIELRKRSRKLFSAVPQNA